MASSGSHYRIEVAERDGVSVVKLLDKQYFSDSQTLFVQRLKEASDGAARNAVVIDLNGVLQLTSGPLGAIRAAHRRISGAGGRIVAAGGGDFAVRVLSFAANFVEHFPTVDEALAAIDASPTEET